MAGMTFGEIPAGSREAKLAGRELKRLRIRVAKICRGFEREVAARVAEKT